MAYSGRKESYLDKLMLKNLPKIFFSKVCTNYVFNICILMMDIIVVSKKFEILN